MKASSWVLLVLVLTGVGLGSYQLGFSRASHRIKGVPPLSHSTPTTPAVAKPVSIPPASSRPAPLWKSAKESRLPWLERIDAVRALPDPLNAAALAELIAFLHDTPTGPKGDWHVVCNEIMEVLRKRNLAPGSYSRLMLELAQDRKAEDVMRDYAAQALSYWITGLDPDHGRETDPVMAQRAFDGLLQEARHPDNAQITLSGTTLRMLTDVVIDGGPELKARRADLVAVALEFADGRLPAAVVNRASAIQVAARLGAPEIPQLCRNLLANEATAPDLRLSAIAALGLTGSRQDVALLQILSKNYHLKYAADAAITRLTQP